MRGSQVYCLVPRDQETSLTVQAYRSDAENGYQGRWGTPSTPTPRGSR